MDRPGVGAEFQKPHGEFVAPGTRLNEEVLGDDFAKCQGRLFDPPREPMRTGGDVEWTATPSMIASGISSNHHHGDMTHDPAATGSSDNPICNVPERLFSCKHLVATVATRNKPAAPARVNAIPCWRCGLVGDALTGQVSRPGTSG